MGAYQQAKDRNRFGNALNRRDIVVEDNPAVAEALVTQLHEPSRNADRLRIRRALIEPQESDPNGFERLIGASQLVSVNFLTRGLRAAAAVCRIRVPAQGGEWYGTGFLVGRRLLMTNNHVIPSPQVAGQTEAEFNFEHDADGVLNPPIRMNLAPHDVFFTDIDHDVTFVAIAPFSDGGVPVERFGYLPLIPVSGKGIQGEWVTIIQHPDGQPKQLTVRASQIIELDKNRFPDLSQRLIHYTTDTEPGSSGAPVLNDQWQVIAIHHKAVPDPTTGISNDSTDKSANVKWLANQGVRISAIYQMLEAQRFSNNHAATVLEQLSRGIGLLPRQVWESIDFGRPSPALETKPLPASHWTQQKFGYDPKFLSVELDLDTILGDRRQNAAKLKEGNGVALDYLHFSVVIDSQRKFAMLTAVNIHGAKLRHPGERSDTWRRDIRLENVYQPADNFYVASKGKDPVAFSRGHLVRRFDPCWGNTLEESRLAETHTFHYSNAAPQVQGYNNVDWGDLEDYVLDRTQTSERKVTVFTGPIFNKFDPLYGRLRQGGPWRIPVTFWKIAVIEKADAKIAAAAFMIGQTEYIHKLYEAKVFTALNPYTQAEIQSRRIQTTIATVEEETGLNFSVLRPFDAQGALESTRQARFIARNDEIII